MSRFMGALGLGLLLVTALNGGCVARTYWHGKIDYPPRLKDHPIDVLLAGEPSPHPFQLLGTARIDGYYFTGSEILIRGAQREARKRGGDAIVLGGAFEYASATAYVGGSPGHVGAAAAATPGGSAAAVVYAPPVPPTPVTVAWPILHTLVLRYDKSSASGERRDP